MKSVAQDVPQGGILRPLLFLAYANQLDSNPRMNSVAQEEPQWGILGPLLFLAYANQLDSNPRMKSIAQEERKVAYLVRYCSSRMQTSWIVILG
jgi:hypothetical protein